MAEMKLRSTVDNSGARAGMEQLRKMAAGVEKQLGLVMRNLGAAFTVGAIVKLGRDTVELGGKIADLATQTGLSMRQFQAMSLAIRDAGGNEEQLLQVMAKLRDSQAQVIAGNKAAVDSWGRLGVSAQDVIRASPADLLELVSQKFAAAGTDGAAFGAVLDIIGARNAPQLTEALQRLAAEGFGKLAADADAAGQVLSDATAKRLDEFGDAVGRWKRRFLGGVGEMLAPVAGMVTGMSAFFGAAKEQFDKQVEKGGYWSALLDPANIQERLRAGARATLKFERSVKPNEDTGGLLSLDDLAGRDRRAAEAKAEADRQAAEAGAKAEQKAASEVDKLRERVAGLEQKRQFDRLQAAERVLDLERRIAEQRRIAETAPAVETPEPVEASAAVPGAVGEKARLEALEKSLQLQDELDKAREEADRLRWDAEERLYELQNRRAEAVLDKERQIADAKAAVVTTAPPVDRLASIGGFGADRASPQMRIAERQVGILERLEAIERRSQQSLERIESQGGYA